MGGDKTLNGKNKMSKIIIGYSDYLRKQIERGGILYIGNSNILQIIREYEIAEYEVKFKTSLFRKIFCIGIYKIIASKP